MLSRCTCSSAVWASIESPGPRFTAGTPRSANRADVGPAQLAAHAEVVALDQRGDAGVVDRRPRRGRQVDQLDRVARLEVRFDDRAHRRLGLLRGPVRGEPVAELDLDTVGHHVAGDSALDPHHLQRLVEPTSQDLGLAGRHLRDGAQQRARADGWRCDPSRPGPGGRVRRSARCGSAWCPGTRPRSGRRSAHRGWRRRRPAGPGAGRTARARPLCTDATSSRA